MASRTASRVSLRCMKEMGGGGSDGWAKIIELAKAPGVINLGQGFPDFLPDIVDAAREETNRALNSAKLCQYSPQKGYDPLRKSIAALHQRLYNETPASVLVTCSGTEAIYAAMQGLVDPGDEVVMFEPFFPWYLPAVRMAGGIPKIVRLRPPSFALLEEDLRAAFTDRTKVCIFNTPHNPTGHMATKGELDLLTRFCKLHDVVAISDEVYEICAFDASKSSHLRLSQVEGMGSRTITIGSASKLLSLTGWRVGWVTGPEDLVEAVATAHNYMTFCAPTPLQAGCAAALDTALKRSESGGDVARECGGLGVLFGGNWNLLADALRSAGISVCPAQGGYFLVADVASTGLNDIEFCTWLVTEHKIAAVPLSLFYGNQLERCTFVRFAVCKTRSLIEEAVAVLKEMGPVKKKVSEKC